MEDRATYSMGRGATLTFFKPFFELAGRRLVFTAGRFPNCFQKKKKKISLFSLKSAESSLLSSLLSMEHGRQCWMKKVVGVFVTWLGDSVGALVELFHGTERLWRPFDDGTRPRRIGVTVTSCSSADGNVAASALLFCWLLVQVNPRQKPINRPTNQINKQKETRNWDHGNPQRINQAEEKK